MATVRADHHKNITTLDDFVEHAYKFVENNCTIAFTLLMDQGGTFDRMRQPCYGELRRYGENSTQPDVSKPGDLHWPFPDGRPMAVAVPVCSDSDDMRKEAEPVLEAIWDPENSPWRSVLKDTEIVYHKGAPKGIILKDTDIDPTAMVSMFMFTRTIMSMSRVRLFNAARNAGATPTEALCALVLCVAQEEDTFYISSSQSYFISTSFSFKNFLAGEIDDTLTAATWINGGDYNRPELQDVFGLRATYTGISSIVKEINGSGTQYTAVPMDKLPALIELTRSAA